jgi:hypothetical protein
MLAIKISKKAQERANPPLPTYCLPDDISNDFEIIAGREGQIHRMLGRIVDEYVSGEFTHHGQRMIIYGLFADLYYRTTGETISARQIRAWRHSAVDYSKHDLERFEALSDSQLTAAIELAETANIDAKEICQWAVDNQVRSVPQMRANYLPPPTGYSADEWPGILSLVRSARHWHFDADPRFVAWIAAGRALMRELMTP